jgi:Flp pilus assembly protein TadD
MSAGSPCTRANLFGNHVNVFRSKRRISAMIMRVAAVVSAGLLCVYLTASAATADELRTNAAAESARKAAAEAARKAAETQQSSRRAGGAELAALIKQLRADPANLELRRQVVEALIRAGRTTTAVEQARLILERAGANTRDLCLLGDAYRYSSNLAGADGAYRQALSLSPLSTQARSGLALTRALRGDWSGAQELCQNGLAQTVDPQGRSQLVATLQSIRDMQISSARARAVPVASSHPAVTR